jgi:hypothetical protein
VERSVIQETCLEIGELQEHWLAEKRVRTARREKIHRIDELIEEFEKLNLAEEAEVPYELRGRAVALITAEANGTPSRVAECVAVSDWMDALYEVQDTLMFASDEAD